MRESTIHQQNILPIDTAENLPWDNKKSIKKLEPQLYIFNGAGRAHTISRPILGE